MFQKHMYALPQRMVKNLNNFLMNERIRRESFHRVGAFQTGKGEGQGISSVGEPKSGTDLIVALRRAESHDDVFGTKYRFQPGPEKQGKIQRGKRALSDNYGMNKFDGDVLGIGRVGTASKGKQTASPEESLGHGAACLRQAGRFPRKKSLDDQVPREQALFHLSRQPTNCSHGTTLKILTNARQGIADQHIHNPAATVTRGD